MTVDVCTNHRIVKAVVDLVAEDHYCSPNKGEANPMFVSLQSTYKPLHLPNFEKLQQKAQQSVKGSLCGTRPLGQKCPVCPTF
eukprot:SAG22_NODE_14662_length_368_cov_1.342007_1_plen_82_part_01